MEVWRRRCGGDVGGGEESARDGEGDGERERKGDLPFADQSLKTTTTKESSQPEERTK